MANEIQVQSYTFGAAFSGATEIPLCPVPGGHGGITVTEAWVAGPAAGTAVGGLLVTMGSVATGGTPAIDGTIGSFAGTIVFAAGVVHKLTIATPYVGAGKWLGFDQTSGTVPAGTRVSVAYAAGK